MFELTSLQGRTIDFSGNLLKADGTPLALNISDKVRVKIGLDNQTPLLDLVSGTTTANGSTVNILDRGTPGTSPAIYQVHLAQGDTSGLYPKPYDVEVDVVDSQELHPPNATKAAGASGVLHILSSQAGGLG